MAKLNYQSDNVITLAGPVNLNLDEAAGVSPTPTVTARLYHERKEVRTAEFVTRLTLDEASSSTLINVPKTTPTAFEAADTVVIDLDDGSVHETTIVSVSTVDAGYDIITLTAGIPTAAAAGSTLRLTKKGATSLILVIQSPGGPITLEKGDAIEIDLDSGSVGLSVDQVRTITAVEDADNVTATVALNQAAFECITLSGATSSAVSAGRRVRRKLGADVVMTAFGTFPTANPVLGDTSWGFRGTIEDTHADLEVGMSVRIEVVYNGGVALQMVKALRANVVEDTA
jgi:hypothetical protein